MRTRILLVLALALSAAAQDRNVEIAFIGQACFYVRTGGGPTVVTDPPAASIGYTLPSAAAEAVTVSHNHGDHNNTAGVQGNPAVVDGRGVTERRQTAAAGMTFTLIPGFHDNSNGSQRGQNTVVRWEQGGLVFAHLGDLGQESLTEAQLADLRNLDVLFIPAGGFFTISPERAAAYVSELKPRIAILMHYRTALAGPAQLAALPAAAAPFGSIVYKPSAVTVSRATIPLSTEVWVMLPASDAAAVNAATFAAGIPVAPGSIVSVFGNFTGAQTASADTVPLPRRLGETEVLIGGQAAPLFYASPTQVNAQVPSGQAPGGVPADVRAGGRTVGRAPLTVVPLAPGLFVAANQDGRANSPESPARPGEVLHIYGTGQGTVAPAVSEGVAAPDTPLSYAGTPNVFLEGRQLEVRFSGLAPRLVGVWQIDVTLPEDTPTGPSLSLVVENGFLSNRLPVAVVR